MLSQADNISGDRPTIDDDGPATNDPRRWWALAVLTLPVLVISMDATILGFAIPSLSAAIEPTSSELLWIVDIYSFVLAGLLVTMGVVGDRIGRRRLLLWGAAGFGAASLLAAFATGPATLIAARAALGVAGATLMPSTLSLIRNIFTDDHERQMAIAVWATAFAVGAAIGPIAGGVVLEHFWWGAVFLIAVPVTIALVVVGPRVVPESRDPSPGRFDIPSAVLSMATTLPVVYAVKTAASHGASWPAAASLVAGIVAGVVFVRRQRRLEDPMIDVGLFRLPRFRMAITGNLLACVGLAGSMFFTTQYLQLVVGMSPLRAGVQLLPAVVSSVAFTLAAPWASRRWGPFAVIAGGLVLGAVGFGLLTQVSATGSPVLAALSIAVLNAGLGAAMTVAVEGIMAAVPPERAGAVASVSETGNELGIALGTAILGSIATAVYRRRIDDLDGTGVAADVVDRARETLGAALGAADELDGAARTGFEAAASGAFVDGLHVAAIAATTALAMVAAWALRTHRAR
ncbi:MAG: MFS transporter [Actinomycetota bacterium]|nr:MFS transporter [Actinomycetota bacterium]